MDSRGFPNSSLRELTRPELIQVPTEFPIIHFSYWLHWLIHLLLWHTILSIWTDYLKEEHNTTSKLWVPVSVSSSWINQLPFPSARWNLFTTTFPYIIIDFFTVVNCFILLLTPTINVLIINQSIIYFRLIYYQVNFTLITSQSYRSTCDSSEGRWGLFRP
jgi:hypothetical protein